MILLQFLLRVGAADDDDLTAVMGRSLVQRCRTQFPWQMAPRDDGDDGMIWMEGGMMKYPSIHQLLISSLTGSCIFLQMQCRCRSQFLWRMVPRSVDDDGAILFWLVWVEVKGRGDEISTHHWSRPPGFCII